MEKKRGQVTIFVIAAIFLVAAIVAFFMLRGSLVDVTIPKNFEPVYVTFLSCVEDEIINGVGILESQGGFIDVPQFSQGSTYMPFGSQLSFVGLQIPYWYYVSGNNIAKEQVPTRSDMQIDLAEFLDARIRLCSFEAYESDGISVMMGEASSKVTIEDEIVLVETILNLDIERGNDSVLLTNHKVEVKTLLGKLYDSAMTVYEKENNELFLESYAIDVLRNYAPVDGVELSCAPKVWSADEIYKDVMSGIEANTLALKGSENDFDLSSRENKYFVMDLGIDSSVRILTSKNWSNAFEVVPSSGALLVAEPVGNQEGLGILGFCYVPYHFVYDLKYPVLFQLSEGDETFQFPMAVVVNKNKPRQAVDVVDSESGVFDFCENKNTEVRVNVYDSSLNNVDSEIFFKCFGMTCDIGKTSGGVVDAYFPQCVNGKILSRAEGYLDSEVEFSTTNEGSVEILMSKLYPLSVDLRFGAMSYSKDAIINFVNEAGGSKSILYPYQKDVELSQGQYEIQVYAYENSSIELQEVTREECVEVPKDGVGSLLGLTEEKCFEVKIPSQIISNVLIGGGRENYYITESELMESTSIEIDAEKLPIPKSVEDLQTNYALFEVKDLEVAFK